MSITIAVMTITSIGHSTVENFISFEFEGFEHNVLWTGVVDAEAGRDHRSSCVAVHRGGK
jgi:hypothetical protein